MLKNIVFDFGNVIGKFDPEYIAGEFCSNDADRSILKPAVFNDWSEIDEGRVEYSEYIERAKSRLPQRLWQTVAELFDGWYKCLPYVEGVEELIGGLKERGYALYVLSNAPTHFSANIGYFKVLDGFSGMVFSADIKMSKPNREIYEYLLDKYSLVPGECLFIDDLSANVAGAERCGMKGYVFDGDTVPLKRLLF